MLKASTSWARLYFYSVKVKNPLLQHKIQYSGGKEWISKAGFKNKLAQTPYNSPAHLLKQDVQQTFST